MENHPITEPSPDFSGNMTSFGGRTFDWTGRQLNNFVDSNSYGIYYYNMDGQRIYKEANGVTTNYYYNGSTLAGQISSDGTKLIFLYDENGDIFGLTYNGDNYYYIKNAQNDVIAIANTWGNILCRYEYDAWGKVLSITGDVAWFGQLNPIRYRSYYYDNESGLYYLQSRYYNPEIGRFICADEVSVVTVSPDSANYDKNLFAYCDNNPVVRADSSGYIWTTTLGIMAVGGAIGAGISAISSALTQKAFNGSINWKSVGVAAASGFVSGALAASPLSKTAITIISVGVDVVSYGADCLATGEDFDAGALVVSVGTGLFLNSKWGDNGLNYNNKLEQVVDYADDVISRGSKKGANQYRKNAANSARNYRNNYLTNEFSGLASGSVRDNTIINGLSEIFNKFTSAFRKNRR